MVYYIEHGLSVIHLVGANESALCGLYSPNWRLPQEPYDLKFVCVTCMAEIVVWQLAGLPMPSYVWYDYTIGALTHERVG